MKLTFRLRFRTRPGQSLLLSGNRPWLGDNQVERAVPLAYVDPENWEITLSPGESAAALDGLAWHYLLRNSDGSLVQDRATAG